MDTTNQLFSNDGIDFSSSSQAQVVALEDFLSDEDIPKPDDSIVDPPTPQEEIDSVLGQVLEGVNPPEDSEVDYSSKGKEDINVVKDVHPTTMDYKSVLSKLISDKVISGIDAIETEDGEIPFDDMDIDEDTFYNIVNQKIKEDKEASLSGTIKAEGVSEFTKRLIDIEKSGGDVNQAIASYNKYQAPLENLDIINSEQDQITVIYTKYNAKGLEDSDIARMIKGFKAEGLLEEKAAEAMDDLQNAFNKHLESIKAQAESQKIAYAEELKKYRNSLKESLGSFELNDNYKKKLLDIATKENNQGTFDLDETYFNLRNNPDTAAEIILFLTDKEEYIKQITKKVSRDANLNTMKKLRLVNRGKLSADLEPSDSKRTGFTDLKSLL